jgi:hypothetical protein
MSQQGPGAGLKRPLIRSDGACRVEYYSHNCSVIIEMMP